MDVKEFAYCSDKYQYTMGKSFMDCGKGEQMAVFNLFYRKAPENNNWAVVSGTDEVVEMIENLGSMPEEFYEKFLPGDEYAEFRHYLAGMKFTGNVYAMREGEIAFPNEPIVIVEAPLIQAQVLETPMLCIMNHQMAVATKASRVCRATSHPVSEFGSRRAHGPWAAVYGAKAAIIAGCASTSNILTGVINGVPSTGTMAHSFVTSYGSTVEGEHKAFCDYINTHRGENLILLIDTYDTLRCGVLNAIRAFKENGIDNDYPYGYGIRLDSGDLAYLSRQARRMMDEAGFPNAKVCASGDLDENVIWDLKQQGACIDSWGVGTRMITSDGCPALGGVYKMSAEIIDGQIVPKIKVSENPAKVTNPGYKKVQRIYNREGMAMADIIMLDHETIDTAKPLTIFHPVDTWKRQTYTDYTLRDLLVPVFVDGECVYTCPKLSEIQSYCKNEISTLWEQYRRRLNPHVYKVDLSYELYALRHQLLNAARTEQGDIPPMQ